MVDDPRTPDDPDAPPTEEEVQASSRLRDALDAEPVVELLRSGWSPGAIGADAHAALVADVPSPDEIHLAARLRDALDLAPAVVAVRAAWCPPEIDPAEHRAIVARALGTNVVRLQPRGGVVVRFAAPVFTALAIAAILVLWIGRRPAEMALAHTRSTQPLFDEPFGSGEASARIDKIAIARAADYRDNRFVKWGVR